MHRYKIDCGTNIFLQRIVNAIYVVSQDIFIKHTNLCSLLEITKFNHNYKYV